MKRIIFLGDGMADWPIDSLDGRTCLQAADTPNMDRIAKSGRCGVLHTIEDDMPSGSATANLGVLGYDARALFGRQEGRGVLEAASMGINVADDEVAFRVNLIGVENNTILNHSAGHISTEEARELIEFCDREIGMERIKLYPGVSYRHLLVLSNGHDCLDCAPPHDNVGGGLENLKPTPLVDEAADSAALLSRMIDRSREILPGHPVNLRRGAEGKTAAGALWPWAPGRKPEMQTFQERFGVTGAVVSAVDLIFGVGVLAGLEKMTVERATGLYDTNYEGKADACIDALKRHDFVFAHVEAPDEAGHEKNAKLKVKTIEDIDRRLIGRVLEQLEVDGVAAVVAVLPDHPTPVATGGHVIEPVPFAIRDPRQQADAVERYDEESARKGSLGELKKDEFIRLVMA